MIKFSENVDEIVAMIMAVAGVAVLLFGTYAIFCMECEISVEELLLISGAMLGPSTGYLFGKSIPKQENTIKDVLIQNMNKPK